MTIIDDMLQLSNAFAHVHTCMTRPHARTQACPHAHTHARTDVVCASMCIYRCAYTHTNTHTHAHTHSMHATSTRGHTYTRTQENAHAPNPKASIMQLRWSWRAS